MIGYDLSIDYAIKKKYEKYAQDLYTPGTCSYNTLYKCTIHLMNKCSLFHFDRT